MARVRVEGSGAAFAMRVGGQLAGASARFPRAVPARAPNSAPALQAASFWHLFGELRLALRLTRDDLAVRLATSGPVIAALEAGDERHLPPWPETVRIITAFLALAGIDPRPVLKAIETQRMRFDKRRAAPLAHAAAPVFAAPGPVPPRTPPGRALVPTTSAPAVVPPDPQPATDGLLARAGAWLARAATSWRERIDAARGLLAGRGMRRALIAFGIVAVLVLCASSSMLRGAVARVAPSLANVIGYAHEFVVVQMAPQREGLRWIEVADPRSRRGDKLPIARQ